MNSVTVVKVGFLVVLLGSVAAGATATSGWLVEDPAESTPGGSAPGESTATPASVADGATTPTANDSSTPTSAAGEAALAVAAPVAAGR